MVMANDWALPMLPIIREAGNMENVMVSAFLLQIKVSYA